MKAITKKEAVRKACWRNMNEHCLADNCMAWKWQSNPLTSIRMPLKESRLHLEQVSQDDFEKPNGEGWVFLHALLDSGQWQSAWKRDAAHDENRIGFCAALPNGEGE